MTTILSHGDRIRRGSYRLHSRFRCAANFVCGTDFVFLVGREAGAGPLNIVLDEPELGSFSALDIGSDGCWLDSSHLPFDHTHRYNSGLQTLPVVRQILQQNIGHFESALLDSARSGLLIPLITGNMDNGGISCFNSACRNRIAEGWKAISEGQWIRGTLLIKGVGPGLTPAGDDFLCGLLTALQVIYLHTTNDCSGILKTVAGSAPGCNPFTNSFLCCAAGGFVPEKHRALLIALCSGTVGNVRAATEQLKTIGHTSGIDFGVGLFLGLRKYLK